MERPKDGKIERPKYWKMEKQKDRKVVRQMNRKTKSCRDNRKVVKDRNTERQNDRTKEIE
jgi:hypothetical protein